MKRWLARSSCLAGGIVAALLIGEAVVRATGLGDATVTRGTLHAFDPEAGWTCQPDCDARFELPGVFNVHVRCNSRGLRDRERSLVKPAGSRRFLALGDSFMWGFGVENDQMFTSRLENLLEGTEVLNFGANGYSTVQELVRLETDGLSYAPDAAILSFCWNDLDSNFNDKEGGRPAVTLGDDGSIQIVNRPVRTPWKSGFTQWLRHNSRLFSALEYVTAVQRLRLRMQAAADTAGAEPENTRTQGAEADEGEFTLMDLFGRPTKEMDRAWEAERALITRIRDRLAEKGARLFVMFVSIKEARSEEAFRESVVAPYERSGSPLDVDWDRPAIRLRAICDELGVPFLDLNPIFRAREHPDALFLHRNGHWSAAGHALAAEAVADKLAECGLATKRPVDGESH